MKEAVGRRLYEVAMINGMMVFASFSNSVDRSLVHIEYSLIRIYFRGIKFL